MDLFATRSASPMLIARQEEAFDHPDWINGWIPQSGLHGQEGSGFPEQAEYADDFPISAVV